MSDVWEDGVVIMAGEFTDGKMVGSIVSADFYENFLEIDCGEGYFWRGTSQEFCEKWERL